ncbi:MAG: hypothetical protein Q4C71_04915 [Microbacteriaceae bacterium]|nr:hypothetical protein [Microbacteriaceae bacterium]
MQQQAKHRGKTLVRHVGIAAITSYIFTALVLVGFWVIEHENSLLAGMSPGDMLFNINTLWTLPFLVILLLNAICGIIYRKIHHSFAAKQRGGATPASVAAITGLIAIIVGVFMFIVSSEMRLPLLIAGVVLAVCVNCAVYVLETHGKKLSNALGSSPDGQARNPVLALIALLNIAIFACIVTALAICVVLSPVLLSFVLVFVVNFIGLAIVMLVLPVLVFMIVFASSRAAISVKRKDKVPTVLAFVVGLAVALPVSFLLSLVPQHSVRTEPVPHLVATALSALVAAIIYVRTVKGGSRSGWAVGGWLGDHPHPG